MNFRVTLPKPNMGAGWIRYTELFGTPRIIASYEESPMYHATIQSDVHYGDCKCGKEKLKGNPNVLGVGICHTSKHCDKTVGFGSPNCWCGVMAMNHPQDARISGDYIHMPTACGLKEYSNMQFCNCRSQVLHRDLYVRMGSVVHGVSECVDDSTVAAGGYASIVPPDQPLRDRCACKQQELNKAQDTVFTHNGSGSHSRKQCTTPTTPEQRALKSRAFRTGTSSPLTCDDYKAMIMMQLPIGVSYETMIQSLAEKAGVIPKPELPTKVDLRPELEAKEAKQAWDRASKAADHAFRFLAGLQLSDMPVTAQKEYLTVVRNLGAALRPDEVGYDRMARSKLVGSAGTAIETGRKLHRAMEAAFQRGDVIKVKR